MRPADQLSEIMDRRIVVHDGAWGVLIHRKRLSEAEYRGERLRDHPRDVKGDPDLLNLTRPDVVFQIGIVPRRIDLLTSIAGVDFEMAWRNRSPVEIEGMEVPVLGRKELILNKRAVGRTRDLADMLRVTDSAGERKPFYVCRPSRADCLSRLRLTSRYALAFASPPECSRANPCDACRRREAAAELTRRNRSTTAEWAS